MKKAKTRPRTKARTTASKPARKASARSSSRPSRANHKEFHAQDVIKTNGVMDLDADLFQLKSARAVAQSLKRSADNSDRLESTPFHSAMGVLNGLISHVELLKARLDASKKELRHLYGEDDEAMKNGEHLEPTPPQEYARKRSAPKDAGAPAQAEKPADNRPRSRPNKVV
jgi:hypothetical protein